MKTAWFSLAASASFSHPSSTRPQVTLKRQCQSRSDEPDDAFGADHVGREVVEHALEATA